MQFRKIFLLPIFALLLSNISILAGQTETDVKKRTFLKYDPAQDVMITPPKINCKIAYEGIDEFSGKKRKDLAPALFFNHTRDELRKILKNKEHISCYGHLASVTGGFRFLVLDFKIAASNAPKAFGGIEKGALLFVHLINGENVRLINNKANEGQYDPFTKEYNFQGQYLIHPKQEKQLVKSEIDKIRVVWARGYEDYEIYEVDFFIRQFECLNKD